MFRAVLVVQLWLVRSWLLLFENECPIYAGEPWMGHDFFTVSWAGAESGERVLVQKFGANVGGVSAQEREI